jgi:hypothetical protein
VASTPAQRLYKRRENQRHVQRRGRRSAEIGASYLSKTLRGFGEKYRDKDV